MPNYQLGYTGAQVDTLLGKVDNPDTIATENSTALITSGAVYAASAAALSAVASLKNGLKYRQVATAITVGGESNIDITTDGDDNDIAFTDGYIYYNMPYVLCDGIELYVWDADNSVWVQIGANVSGVSDSENYVGGIDIKYIGGGVWDFKAQAQSEATPYGASVVGCVGFNAATAPSVAGGIRVKLTNATFPAGATIKLYARGELI